MTEESASGRVKLIRLQAPGFRGGALEGWHPPEEWGVWSASSMARILIPLPPSQWHGSSRVLVVLGPPAPGASPTVPAVFANGEALRSLASNTATERRLEGSVDDRKPWVLLEFRSDELLSPASVGVSDDSRRLGISVVRVEIATVMLDPLAKDAGTDGDVEFLPAQEVVDASRLDVIVKARFFHALMTGLDFAPARQAYFRHIELRTGGREPADFRGRSSCKECLADYDLACRALLLSMRERGFDRQSAIPLDEDGHLLNGAHRTACALALGLNLAVIREQGDAGTWGMAWFEQQGHGKRDRLRLLFDLVRLVPSRSSVFVLWPHLVDRWDAAIESIAAQGCDVAGYVDLAWPETQRAAYESLIFDLYSHGVVDLVDGFAHIERKMAFLRLKPCFLRVGVCLLPAGPGSSWDRIPSMKKAIREEFAAVVAVDRFVTCHFADTIEESRHMARTLLLPENLDAASARSTAQPRREFLGWLNHYLATLRQLEIDPDDCCIVGSAGLEIQGVRLSTDIDFTVRRAIRSSRFTSGVTRFDSGIDLVTEGYHRSESNPVRSDDDVIDEPGLHVYFRGLKVVSTGLIGDRKAFSRRPKDLLDVELILERKTARFAEGR